VGTISLTSASCSYGDLKNNSWLDPACLSQIRLVMRTRSYGLLPEPLWSFGRLQAIDDPYAQKRPGWLASSEVAATLDRIQIRAMNLGGLRPATKAESLPEPHPSRARKVILILTLMS
jgi:hypothetical protein